ncbi:aldo/keto reductase [Curtobacterium sp. L3-7]|uniref:aldo/keto reductase n=1 Tax=Curtobacterium sp. L3-7 TaxID=3138787 RepID=UPI003B5200DA
MAHPVTVLRDGTSIPSMGFGVGEHADIAAERYVTAALEAGFRLVDTARSYGNERGVGAALRRSGIPRDDVFLQSKLRGSDQGGQPAVRAALGRTLEALGTDHIDGYLIHWPLPRLGRFEESWEAILTLAEEGLVRAPGVSNFTLAHLDNLERRTSVLPLVNQVQSSPSVSRCYSVERMRARGVQAQAYSPLEHASGLHRTAALRSIADEVGATTAQVVLRWHLDAGRPFVVHSTSPARLREDLGAADVTLSPRQREVIDRFDHDEAHAVDPDEHHEM